MHKVCLERWQRVQYEKAAPLTSDVELARVFTCQVCKAQYSHRIPLQCGSPLLSLRSRLSVVALLLLLLLTLPLLLNIVLCLLVFIACCYLIGLRPDLVIVPHKQTPDGMKVVFIHIGRRVAGLETGVQLEATSAIKGGIFEGSTVLLLKYTHDGAVGVILNKTQYNENLAEEVRVGVRCRQGPIASQSLIVVHTSERVAGAQPVADGVFLGGDYSGVLAQGCPRLEFWGFACWKAGQLDGEVRAGVWKPLGAATPDRLFPAF